MELDLLCDELGCESPGLSPEKLSTAAAVARPLVPSKPRFPPPSELTIAGLLKHERDHMPAPDYITTIQEGVMTVASRLELVECILQVCVFHQMSPTTAVLAVNYFDRFLSVYKMPELQKEPWGLHLASVACLFIAAKMEEVEIPPITSLQVGIPIEFERHCVERFELHILRTLSWRMKSTTPLSYLAFILQNMDLPPSLLHPVTERCVEILVDTLREVKMLEFRPSVITIAIIRCAFLDCQFEKNVDWERHIPSICQRLNCPMELVLPCQHYVQMALLAPPLPHFLYPPCLPALVSCNNNDLVSPTGILDSSEEFCAKRRFDDTPSPPKKKRLCEDNGSSAFLSLVEASMLCREELSLF